MKPGSVEPRARARKIGAVAKRIATGTAIKHACALEGLPCSTFYLWVGEDAELALVVDRARAKDAERRRREIEVHARKGNKGANVLLHLLERAHPGEWSEPPKRLQHEGHDGGPVKAAIALSVEQALAGARDGSIPGEGEGSGGA